MTELELNRNKINQIDMQIAQLFEQRMDAAKNIALYKKQNGLQVFDSSREHEILKKEVEFIKNQDYKPYYLEFIQDLMDVSKKYQSSVIQGSKIAYSGIEGAWANIAAKRLFPNGNLISFNSFEQAYKAVDSGECDFAVLPVENSFAGDVGQVFDLMHSGRLFVNGMYNLRITQSLLAVKGTKISDIKKVISHQQALDQCMNFLQKHGFESEAVENTAVAAKKVATLNDKTVAAIASAESANLYGLEILEKTVNENAQNTTRFAVFSKALDKNLNFTNGSIFQMMFTVKNIPGSLAKAIKKIADAGYNLRALRSRPIKNVPWQYYFYAEGEGSLFTPKGEKLLAEMGKDCEEIKVLGHYCQQCDI